jgi:hypothetical protein
MALNPNQNVLARFRINDDGSLRPIDSTGSVNNSDLVNRRAGAGSVSIVNDPTAPQPQPSVIASIGITQTGPVTINDFVLLGRMISMQSLVPVGQPLSMMPNPLVISWQSLIAGNVVPQVYVDNYGLLGGYSGGVGGLGKNY